LRDFDVAYLFEPFLAFFLFFPKLAFTRDVAAVTFRRYVFTYRPYLFGCQDRAANGGLKVDEIKLAGD